MAKGTSVTNITSLEFSATRLLGELSFFCARLHFQATQKGDPVATLRKQLEEKEKQLATEQEDASAAKNRLREMTKVRDLNPNQLPLKTVYKCVHRTKTKLH